MNHAAKASPFSPCRMVSDDGIGELEAQDLEELMKNNDEVGPVGNLFESCVQLLRSLSTEARESDAAHSRSLESNLATLIFWDDEFGASGGHLDKALEHSEENRDLTLSTLISLADFLSHDLLNATLPLPADREDMRQKSSIHARVDKARGIIMDTETPAREETSKIEDVCEVLDSKVARLNVLGPILEESIPSGTAFEQVAPHGQLLDRPAHQYYADLISIRFPNARTSLVESLGKCNWERYMRIYRKREENTDREVSPIGETENMSKFHDSGLGTSVPAQSAFGNLRAPFAYAETEVSKRAEASHRRLPPLPEEGRKGWPFLCEVCNSVVRIRRTNAWKKHVFSDVLAYVCIFDDCPSDRCFFEDRDAFAAHLGNRHGFAPAWKSAACPLCLEETGNGMNTISLHFARHMEEVALGAIPRAVESDASSDESLSEASSENSRSYRFELDEESKEKGMCPIEGCGRVFTDLKAHMLTHVNERPEKCPITTCEYHLKGFARKYDRNRHTLTHYKGTMVCDFCPGSGSAAEKSFNRADVFKRHLTSVHGVEQTPPNSRKKSPITKKAYTGTSTVGTCSICSFTFANAQVFYEHLDECVLGVVQQADPAEAINKKLLSSIANDDDVKETLSRHLLPNQITEHTENRDDDEENNNHQFSYDDLQQAKMQSKEGFSGHDILNPLSEANKEPIFDTLRCACGYNVDDGNSVLCEVCMTWQHVLCYYDNAEQVPQIHECVDCRPRTIDQARVKERQKVLSSLIKQEPKRPALKSHKKKPKDMGAIVAPTYEHTSPVSARSQAVRMAKEQALTDQHHDHFDVPSNDPSDIRPVPNFDRTMADIYTDNLFSPNITERSAQPYNADSPSPFSNTSRNVLTDRLQAAHRARSKSPEYSSRGMNPFKQGSSLAPSSDTFSLREQQKAEADMYSLHQMQQQPGIPDPKTISPKDALLDYHEAEEDSMIPLSPGDGFSFYDDRGRLYQLDPDASLTKD